jgi:hypothetical protein
MPISWPSAMTRRCSSGWVSRAVHIVAELGIADAVAIEGTPVADVARATGTDEDALSRIVRLLSGYGVFNLDGSSVVSHTPASEVLRSDHPGSLRAYTQMFGLPVNWRTAEGLMHSVRTGEATAPRMFPDGGFWGYLASHPDEARVFDAAMVAKAAGQLRAILAAYDFSQFRMVADVGGGQGHLLRAILDANPRVRGVLFDLPHVIAAARAGRADERLAYCAGDFFKDDLPGCDAYVLMEVLHDWSDAPAAEIVSAVRRSASGASKLLVIERVVSEGSAPDYCKILDVLMLGLFGGKQRTLLEYRELLAKGGFDLRREIDTGAGISIFEAEPI